jgi:hypothetical protein
MIEKIKGVGNPLTIIAIFAALAEVMGTVSLRLIDKSLQPTFIWFLIIFPCLLVVLFFLTLNFNTRSIYAPSDFRDEYIFKSLMLNERIQPDEKINTDKEYVEKTAKALGVDKNKKVPLTSSEIVSQLFMYRYNIEKELVRLSKTYLESDNRKGIIHSLGSLTQLNLLTAEQVNAIRNIYGITSMAIHAEEDRISHGQIEFVHKIAPGLIEELRDIS